MGEVLFFNVGKAYEKNRWVIENFNLRINDGEFCVLLGPSGCGKSTILRMIAGLEEITAGRILIDGEVINAVSPKDRDVAMVFQNYALYPHKTVYKNIEYPLKLRKVDKAQRHRDVMQAAELLNMQNFLDRYPRQLSGGQKQRTALGRALVRRPRVYLFDEPLSNLDARLRSSMRSELKLLHRKFGITFVYVTHDQVEAMTLADRIVVLEDGTPQQVGAPQEIYNHPQNTFVASFIGSPPMNLISIERHERMIFGNFEIRTQDIADRTEVILGIRPEALSFDPRHSDRYFEAEKVLVETVGKEFHIHLKPFKYNISSDQFIAAAAFPGERKNTVARVFFKPEDLKVFSAVDGTLLIDGLGT
jgi:multiple sugar transport system ATP-binding protein